MKFLLTTILFVTSLSVYSQTKEESLPSQHRMPSFPGGYEEMYKYIYENLKYPIEAFRKKISGQVVIQFVVTEDGTIADARVVRGIGYGCDEEALRVVESMDDRDAWEPGLKDGRPIPIPLTLPIKFHIQDKD